MCGSEATLATAVWRVFKERPEETGESTRSRQSGWLRGDAWEDGRASCSRWPGPGPDEPVSLHTAGAGNAGCARKLTDYTKTDQRVRGERSPSQPGRRALVSRICEGVKRNFSESIVAHLGSSANEEMRLFLLLKMCSSGFGSPCVLSL